LIAIHVKADFDVLTYANDAPSVAAPADYAGLDRIRRPQANRGTGRKRRLAGKNRSHALKVPRGDRSGVIIEPWLTDQWYVKTQQLGVEARHSKPWKTAVSSSCPKQYENMYFAWMRDLQDWCISRQLWWGHRIPAWYDNSGKVYVAAPKRKCAAPYKLECRR
jgi:valyl-tRNA synthetase